MKNFVACSLVLLATAGYAVAGAAGISVPEINGASATGALTLLSGALLVLRSRRK